MLLGTSIAGEYFELSNMHDLDRIASLFTDDTEYISANTGTFRGHGEIMAMMRAFHNSFKELHWKVHTTKETQPDTFLFDFTMEGIKLDGTKVCVDGLEYITVQNEKIMRIEIKNS